MVINVEAEHVSYLLDHPVTIVLFITFCSDLKIKFFKHVPSVNIGYKKTVCILYKKFDASKILQLCACI